MSVQYLSTILAQLHTNIALVTNASVAGGKFTVSSYNTTLDKEPDSAFDGKYFIGVKDATKKERFWGTGEYITDANIGIQISFFRGGGDANAGDIQGVMRNAVDDCQRIADVIENPLNYNSAVTGLREIRYMGAYKVKDLKRGEVWEARFWLEWRSDLAVSAVIAASTGGDVGMMTIAGEFKSTDTIGEEDVATQAVFFNFDDVSWINVAARLMGRTKVTGGTGTYNLRMGGTPGLPDGTVIATGTATGLSYVMANLAGNPFVNPKGEQLIQVTFKNDTVGQSSFVRDISISLRAA